MVYQPSAMINGMNSLAQLRSKVTLRPAEAPPLVDLYHKHNGSRPRSPIQADWSYLPQARVGPKDKLEVILRLSARN